MNIEVEQKFPVSDPAALQRRLAELGCREPHTMVQVDCYYAHPARDFAASDEALRLRRVSEKNYITYKGPKLDSTTKSRREIEIPLADGQQSAVDAGQLLEALGFRRVAEVSKRRMHSTLRWQERDVEIALDEVAQLGNFVELEIMATGEELPAARDSLAALAKQLELTASERRSYLELLLEQRS